MVIDNSRKAFELLKNRIRTDVEEVWVVALDTQLEILGVDLLFRGSLDRCLFHPREIFRFVYQKNSHAFLIAHSHPSGQTEASKQDLISTKKLLSLALLHEVRLIDHLIISSVGFSSMADKGHLSKLHKKASTLLQGLLL